MSTFYDAPPWRFVVTRLGGAVVSILDPFALNRTVTYTLNDAAVATCDLPSDNPEVNLDESGEPFVSFNDKLLYCFRREDPNPGFASPWVVRFAGLISQLNDEITPDATNPTTHLTAFDPWHYLDSRPVLDNTGQLPDQTTGLVYPAGTNPNTIIVDLLQNAITFANPPGGGPSAGPPSAQACFIDQAGGHIDVVPATFEDINFLAGTSVGEAWRQIVQMGLCDIVLDPIYDPVMRPGILCTLNIYYPLAGQVNNSAIFSWDMAGRSLVGINRLQDGATMANIVQYYSGQGGPPVKNHFGTAGPEIDQTSLAEYGPYWLQQSWPGQSGTPEAVDLAAYAQVISQRFGVDTLTVDPIPERSPIPLLDYKLGDRVPVWANDALRLPIQPIQNINGTWDFLWRVGQIPIVLPDGVPETVQSLLLLSAGNPPATYHFTPISTTFSENSALNSPRRIYVMSILKPPFH